MLPIFEAMSRSHTLYQVASAVAPTVSIVPNSARCGKLAREGAHVGGGARRLRKRLFGKRNRCKYFRHTHGYVCMSRIHVRGVKGEKKQNYWSLDQIMNIRMFVIVKMFVIMKRPSICAIN